MASNFLELISEEQLIADYHKAYAEWQAAQSGQDFASITVGGKTVSMRVRPVGEIQTSMADILDALKDRNPTQYGLLVERTAAKFV